MIPNTSKICVGLVLAASLASSGCATAIRGSQQSLAVDSSPQGAGVMGSNGASCPATPCTLANLKRNQPFTLEFSKPGYEPTKVDLKSGISGDGGLFILGNILAGGVIGIVIDLSTGAINDLTPNPVTATLMAAAPAAAPGAPVASPPAPAAPGS